MIYKSETFISLHVSHVIIFLFFFLVDSSNAEYVVILQRAFLIGIFLAIVLDILLRNKNYI